MLTQIWYIIIELRLDLGFKTLWFASTSNFLSEPRFAKMWSHYNSRLPSHKLGVDIVRLFKVSRQNFLWYHSHFIRLALHQWFPTFWVLSPGILFYEQFWSHVASKLSEIYHFGNFSGPAWTFFKSRYRDRSRWLGTSALHHTNLCYCINIEVT